MKIILRNFLSVLRRYRLATTLNVLGLSVAFATFMVIMMQVDYDRNFDRCHPDADRIFRMESTGNDGDWMVPFSRAMAEGIFQSSPHILAGAMQAGGKNSLFFSVEHQGNRNFYEENQMRVSPSWTDVFTFEMVEGSDRALQEPDKALIPQSLARKLFGDEPAVGRLLKGRDNTYQSGFGYDANQSYTVGGVYRDFPRNSTLSNEVYTPIPPQENKDDWGNGNYACFIRTDDPRSLDGVFEQYLRTFDFSGKPDWLDLKNFECRFTPLPELHYVTGVKFDGVPKSSRQTLLILWAIAIAIVVIAGINYTNFSTALVPKRIRSINIQKVLGGDTRVIRTALMMEGVIIALTAFLLALAVVDGMKHTPLASLVEADLSLTQHGGLLALTAGLALLTGVMAGLYPSWYVTSFPPALTLKGSFGLSPKGRRMRNLLVGIQFIVSFVLIVGASFIHLQNRFMHNSSTGYNRDEVIVTNLTSKVVDNREALTGQLEKLAGISGVTYSSALLSGGDIYMTWGRNYKDRMIHFQCVPVDPSFLRVMGIELTDGRDFVPEDAHSDGVYIFNEKARTELELVKNSKIGGWEVVGFMPDIKILSFRKETEPMAFLVSKMDWVKPNFAYVKVQAGSNLRTAMAHVRQTLKEFDPDYPFDVRFFDEVLQKTYESEWRLGLLIALFSLIAIFISLAGVFGIVVFDSEYRRKEIGIRKVFGATTGEILMSFNKAYVRILCICFVLSAPVAWYAVSKWLESFAYKTPMYWWVYLAAFAAVFVLTVSTVTFQNWRAANMNPVESIKSN